VGDFGLTEQQSGVLSAVDVAVESPAGSLQPPGGRRRTGSQTVILVQPNRAHSRSAELAQRLEDTMRPLPSADTRLDLTQPPGRVGQQIEALRLGCRLLDRQRAGSVVAGLPVMSSQGVAGRAQCVDPHHARIFF
jgi:hypothetical protein